MTDLATRPTGTFDTGPGTPAPGQTQTGIMYAIAPPTEITDRVARADGTPADQMHVTLVTFPFTTDDAEPGLLDVLTTIGQTLGSDSAPVEIELTHGSLFGPDLTTYALEGGECLGLRDLRDDITEQLTAAGIGWSNDYAYRPHLTIGDYPDGTPPDLVIGPLPEEIGWAAPQLLLVFGDTIVPINLTGAEDPDGDDETDDQGEGAPGEEPGETEPTASTIRLATTPVATAPVVVAPEDDEDPTEPLPTAAAMVTEVAAWQSECIVPYGVKSCDGRRIANPLRTRPLPLPFAATYEIGSGHDGAGFAGNILSAGTNTAGNGMAATGNFDLARPEGRESQRLINEERMMGVSVDLADLTVEITDWDEETDPFGENATLDVVDGRLIGHTHVMHPAFAEACIRPNGTAALVAGGAPTSGFGHRLVRPLTAAGAPDRHYPATLHVFDGGVPHVGAAIPGQPGRYSLARMTFRAGARRAFTILPEPAYLVAAGAPALIGRTRPDAGSDDYLATPPARMFTTLGDDIDHALIVRPDGEMVGLLARWKDCHLSYADRCIPPPRTNSGYSRYMSGRITTAEGTQVAVGPIFADTIHPSLQREADDAYGYYHDTGCLIAQVTVGENRHGIWMHGALMPGCTPRQKRIAAGGRVSGDWRPIKEHGYRAELISVLCVNGPGFATPGAEDDQMRQAIVAAGRPDAAVLFDADGQLTAAVGLGSIDTLAPCEQTNGPGHLTMIDQVAALVAPWAARVEVLEARLTLLEPTMRAELATRVARLT